MFLSKQERVQSARIFQDLPLKHNTDPFLSSVLEGRTRAGEILSPSS